MRQLFTTRLRELGSPVELVRQMLLLCEGQLPPLWHLETGSVAIAQPLLEGDCTVLYVAAKMCRPPSVTVPVEIFRIVDKFRNKIGLDYHILTVYWLDTAEDLFGMSPDVVFDSSWGLK